MSEREVCIDTNVIVNVFGSRRFSAREMARGLAERRLTLVLPEIALAQAVAYHDVEKSYRRFCNIVELAHEPDGRAALGASLGIVHDGELLGVQIRETPRSEGEYLEGLFRAAESRSAFATWHAHAHRETVDYLSAEARLAIDQRAEEHVRASFPDKLSTPQKRAENLRALLPQIPAGSLLDDGWIMSWFVRSEGDRRRVAAEPARFPSISCLTLALTLNGFGAALAVRGHHEFDHLAAAKDSWTDALLMASSVYADVFASEDRRCRKRAAVVAGWGHFPPEITSWGDLWRRGSA